jgi:hypothetical protein
MNNVTDEQIALATRFSRIATLRDMLSDEKTEWKAIVWIQNELDEQGCAKYLHALDSMKCNLVTATIDQRIQAFIKINLKTPTTSK